MSLQEAKESYYKRVKNFGVSRNSKGYIKELEKHITKQDEINAEMLEALKHHIKFRCATFDECYYSDVACTWSDNCRYIKTAKIIEKADGRKISDIIGV